MTRHFLALYLLIIVTLAVVSWGQDRVLQLYGSPDAAEDKPLAVAMLALADRLHTQPVEQWKSAVAAAAKQSGADLELLATADLAGQATLQKLRRGEIAYLQTSSGRSWALKQLNDDYVLALTSVEPGGQRGLLEWSLTLAFYAAIALVLMIWIWPLTRDLRALEDAAARFGNRNWLFKADIRPHSQIYPLAQTFRKMASRIDELIASHKDMSSAVSHEIKTPLARMQFEIELAQASESVAEIKRSLSNIKTDIRAIDDLVGATLDYAILDRAGVSLNIGRHNFAALIPAVAESVTRDAPAGIHVSSCIEGEAAEVICDVHLLEAVLRNLLHNAVRYARRDIRVTFRAQADANELIVDDDGPGIPEPERQRVFESFVQLERKAGRRTGFGLGLAIVRRAIEWHGGTVAISSSPLGGARVRASWPACPGQPVGSS